MSNPTSLKTEPTKTPSTKTKSSLWNEIYKGWLWVVFSWKTLRRIGGIREIIITLTSTAIMLLKRTQQQWEYNKKNKQS